MINEAKALLQKYYGYSSFKKGQEKIISSILAGKDTFGIMPTGGGKSICYQIPSLMFPGTTLVISPLISLMKDQVDALDKIGIPAAYINSTLGQQDLDSRISSASQGKYKILYIAPERLESDRFLHILKTMNISLLAIDEAHCVSQWGHDFRPSYRSIIQLIKELPKRPVISAFTATATEIVKNDVISLLGLKSPNSYVTGFDRENLFFSVIKGAKKLDFILDYLDTHRSESGIIYAATRKEVDKIYEVLTTKGYPAGRYHAGMSDEDRSHSQEAFLYDNIQVMVATNAFGMGIDKSNVRYVLHFNMPKNIEAYYQEAGRAGRDGDPAECILLYGAHDLHIQKFLIEQSLLSPERKANEYKKLQEMSDYCHCAKCLRKYILEYFGEEEAPKDCGNCGNCNDSRELSDITVEAQKILSCVKRMKERYGINLVAGVLKGANTKKLRQLGFDSLTTYGIMKEYSLPEITDMVNLLAAEDYLQVSGDQYPVVRLSKKGVLVLQGTEKVLQRIQKKKQQVQYNPDLELFELLRALRKEISLSENVPPYVIFHDATLREMCRHLPTSANAMLQIPGVGENKLNKFGEPFIKAIQKYMDAHGLAPAAINQPSPKPKEDKTPSHQVTYAMYRQGKSPEEIAVQRDMSVITIQEHLVRCWKEGMEIQWDTFIPEGSETLILQVIEKVGAEKLRPIKEQLPEEIDYFAIKAVLCKHGF